MLSKDKITPELFAQSQHQAMVYFWNAWHWEQEAKRLAAELEKRNDLRVLPGIDGRSGDQPG